MEELRKNIIRLGERLPKKHGAWYRLNIWEDNFLILDTWNKHVYYHKGCIPSDTNNMYHVVYTFTGFINTVSDSMADFWNAHIKIN